MEASHYKIFILSVAALVLAASVRAADIVIGIPNWTSVQVTGHVLKTVLEDNLGLEVETQTGTNPIVFEAMERGSMHIHPEVWLPNQQHLHDNSVKDKKVVDFNTHAVEAFQGVCVTRMTADKHDVTSIYDLTDPDKARLFDTDDDGRGEMWIGPQGWASTPIEMIRAKSYGYAETFELMTTDEAVNYTALGEAVRQNKPYVFVCYKPNTVFVLYDLVRLDEPAHDPAKWNIRASTDDPEWLKNSDAPVAWKEIGLHIHWSKVLEKSHPDVVNFLANVSLDADTVTKWMHEVDNKKRDGAEVAREWVAQNSGRVESWLGN